MIRAYINENRTRFLEEWASLIRIPSVSCQPAHKEDMLRCAERWRELLLAAGAQHAEVMPSAGNPFVYAEYLPMEVKGERLEVKGVVIRYGRRSSRQASNTC
jgi:acetylornithine deacetylase/succinyl-diaminopimelate desuccinylase-like protein